MLAVFPLPTPPKGGEPPLLMSRFATSGCFKDFKALRKGHRATVPGKGLAVRVAMAWPATHPPATPRALHFCGRALPPLPHPAFPFQLTWGVLSTVAPLCKVLQSRGYQRGGVAKRPISPGGGGSLEAGSPLTAAPRNFPVNGRIPAQRASERSFQGPSFPQTNVPACAFFFSLRVGAFLSLARALAGKAPGFPCSRFPEGPLCGKRRLRVAPTPLERGKRRSLKICAREPAARRARPAKMK